MRDCLIFYFKEKTLRAILTNFYEDLTALFVYFRQRTMTPDRVRFFLTYLEKILLSGEAGPKVPDKYTINFKTLIVFFL